MEICQEWKWKDKTKRINRWESGYIHKETQKKDANKTNLKERNNKTLKNNGSTLELEPLTNISAKPSSCDFYGLTRAQAVSRTQLIRAKRVGRKIKKYQLQCCSSHKLYQNP